MRRKQLLIEALVITYPGPSKMCLLSTDASSKAAGAVLFQVVERKGREVAYLQPTAEELPCNMEKNVGCGSSSEPFQIISAWPEDQAAH